MADLLAFLPISNFFRFFRFWGFDNQFRFGLKAVHAAGIHQQQTWSNQVFTSEQAFESREIGEPIMISVKAGQRICDGHGASVYAFIAEAVTDSCNQIDAADLLEWLGY